MATPLMLLLITSPVRASLYLTGNATFGANSITVDPSSGLGWLNLSEAAGLSYEQVSSEMGAGGTFNGFRYATVQEVVGLYSSVGLTASTYGVTADYYPASSPGIQTLFSLIGTSGTINGESGIIALSGTSPFSGGYCAPSIYGFASAGDTDYWVNDGSLKVGSTIYGGTFSDPTISSWLVEEVPEPASAQFLILAVVSWRGFRFLQQRGVTFHGNSGGSKSQS